VGSPRVGVGLLASARHAPNDLTLFWYEAKSRLTIKRATQLSRSAPGAPGDLAIPSRPPFGLGRGGAMSTRPARATVRVQLAHTRLVV